MNFIFLHIFRCPKCYRAVYAPERVFVGRKIWHKTCLICQTCSRTLNSQLINEVCPLMQFYYLIDICSCIVHFFSMKFKQLTHQTQRVQKCGDYVYFINTEKHYLHFFVFSYKILRKICIYLELLCCFFPK